MDSNKHAEQQQTEWQPFPVEALPEPCRAFVIEAAATIGSDTSYVALPLLAAVAGVVGNSRAIKLKSGWTEPAVVWAAIVGASGTLKSPAIEAVTRPLNAWQAESFRRHAEAIRGHTEALLRYDVERRAWQQKGAKAGEPAPNEPKEPICHRVIVSEPTVEALALLLRDNPRGLLLYRDELAGLLKGFGQYKGGKGGDCQHFLTMHGARMLLVDRKTGDHKVIHVPRAALSVTGGVQPEILREALGREHFQDGFAARLLLAYPPPQVKRWTEAQLSKATEADLKALFDALMELEPDVEDNGDEKPRALPLSESGKAAWVEFYTRHAAEQATLAGDLAAAWSKLEGYAARLALLVHLVRQASGDDTLERPDEIDAASIGAGVTLVRWFGNEAKRIYGVLSETDEQRDRRELIALVREHGGRITARELAHSKGHFREPGAADEALAELVKAHKGTWQTEPTAGRPRTVFVLTGAGDSNGSPLESERNGTSVTDTKPDEPEEDHLEEANRLFAEASADEQTEPCEPELDDQHYIREIIALSRSHQ